MKCMRYGYVSAALGGRRGGAETSCRKVVEDRSRLVTPFFFGRCVLRSMNDFIGLLWCCPVKNPASATSF